MSVVLYSCEPSVPCRVVRMVAQHIGIALTIKEVDIAAGDTQLKDFLKLNPAHTVLTMVDGNVILNESRAIVTYILDRQIRCRELPAPSRHREPRNDRQSPDVRYRHPLQDHVCLLLSDAASHEGLRLRYGSPNERRSGSDRAAPVRQPLPDWRRDQPCRHRCRRHSVLR
ncbi:unnamed protein product [Ixodes pacificus]